MTIRDEVEKAGKLTSPYAKSSERLQKVEMGVNEIFKRLRKEEI